MKNNFNEIYSDLKNKFENLMNESWNEAKQEKKKANTVFLIITCVIVGIAIIFLSLNFDIVSNLGGLLAMFGFQAIIFFIVIELIIYVIVNAIFSKKRNQYSKMFKSNIINYLLNNFYTEVKYTPEIKMPSNIYDEAKHNEYYNRYYSDDYMEAKIDNKYDIKMAEVKTQKVETHRSSNGHTHTTTTTIFHGMFAKITLDKSINNDLLIRGTGETKWGERLKMDSSEFEKYFDVSSKDKIIGMQILTHDLMQVLLDFKKNNKYDFDISIYNNIIYLRFNTGTMFEIKSIEKGGLEENLIKDYFNILKFINDLTDELIKAINETQI